MNKHQTSLIFLIGFLFGLGTSLVSVTLLLKEQGVVVSIEQSKPQQN